MKELAHMLSSEVSLSGSILLLLPNGTNIQETFFFHQMNIIVMEHNSKHDNLITIT